MKRLLLTATASLALATTVPGGIAAAGDNWFEITSPHFTVWTNANDRATRTLVWQFEQIRNVAKTLWPWMKIDLPKPLMIIAAKDEQTMKALAPGYWELKGGVRPVSVWVSGPDQHYIAIRSDLRAPDNVSVNPHTSAYFAYANLTLASSFEGELPLWLSRGLSGVISNTLVRQDDIVIGAVLPWHLESLRERRLPLRQMLSMSRRSPDYLRDEAQRYFDAQSWAFVHYLMFGDDARNDLLDGLAVLRRLRQKHQAHAVFAGRRQGSRRHRPQEGVRHLNEDAGAVAGVDLAPAGAAMLQVFQDLQRLTHDRVRLPAFDVDDEADAAGVVLVLGIV